MSDATNNHETPITTLPTAGSTDFDANEDTGAILVIGAMPPGAILTKDRLARIFNRGQVSIDRAVARGELPHPAKLLGSERWTSGSIIRHIEKRMAEAAEDAKTIEKHRI